MKTFIVLIAIGLMAVQALAQPTLVSPSDGATFTDSNNNINFSWSTVSGAVHYEIWIDNASGFGSPEIGYNNGVSTNWQNDGMVTSASFALIPSWQFGIPQNVYYWKVRALNASNQPIPTSPGWSSVRSFSLLDQPIGLSGPSEGAVFTKSGSSITFTWAAQLGAPRYEIWIYNASGFGSP